MCVHVELDITGGGCYSWSSFFKLQQLFSNKKKSYSPAGLFFFLYVWVYGQTKFIRTVQEAGRVVGGLVAASMPPDKLSCALCTPPLFFLFLLLSLYFSWTLARVTKNKHTIQPSS